MKLPWRGALPCALQLEPCLHLHQPSQFLDMCQHAWSGALSLAMQVEKLVRLHQPSQKLPVYWQA